MKFDLTPGSSHEHEAAISTLPSATRLWVEGIRQEQLATPVPIVVTQGQPRTATPAQLSATATARAARTARKTTDVLQAIEDHRVELLARPPSDRAGWLHGKMQLQSDRYRTQPSLKFVRAIIKKSL